MTLEDYYKVKKVRGTSNVSGGSVSGEQLELVLVKGRPVPAAEVVCKGVVTNRNMKVGHLEIVERRQQPDLAEAELQAECS